MQRGVWASVVAVTICAGLVGCAPASENGRDAPPTSSDDPTTDASAATEGFLEYVRAANSARLDDPASIDRVLDLTTATQYDFEKSFYGQLRDNGWSVEGSSAVQLVEPLEDSAEGHVALAVCLDVGGSKILDENHQVQERPQQLEVQPMLVWMARPDSAGERWKVAKSTPRQGDPEC